MTQRIITAENNYVGIDVWINDNNIKKIFVVGGGSVKRQTAFQSYLEHLVRKGIGIVYFSDYQPNPLYESVEKGVKLFRDECCNAIMAVGGGSALDVAKCVKLFSNMSGDGAEGAFLRQVIVPNRIPFLAMPTTAGTGSEATRYAVIYHNGSKQSVTHESSIPDTVLMDSSVLKTLPLYQKKATMMDAYCHALESFWSVNSTEKSKVYSRKAIELVLAHMEGYLANTDEGNAGMLLAANVAGKAINITQTTAGHAMCYKITSLFGVAHGHAAFLCNRKLFPWMIANTEVCIDPRGEGYLNDVLLEIAVAMGCKTAEEAAAKLECIFVKLELEVPTATEEQLEVLKTSVNPVRLKNHPVKLTEETIDMLYRQILKE